ncbi:hypothetical protein FJZ33_05340 [Candidatus Poribacteria bacterium]|nr:hypothetical protein [Candidatus Poribacteria bacterium]
MKHVSLIAVVLFLLLVVQSVGICAPGLVASWSFDEGSGNTARDITGNGHNGTISSPKWVAGKI